MLQLQILGSTKPPIWLVKEIITLGSSEDCDLVLPSDSAELHHAEIRSDQDELVLDALHPMLCDGVPVTQTIPLVHGMQFTLGQVTVVVVDPKLERARQDVSPADHESDLWSLISVSTALAGKHYSVRDNYIVGRSKECEMCLGVNHLSRRHARFMVSGDELVLEDLASANGTFVNGERIQKKRLWHGDEVRFDTLAFRVVAPGKHAVAEDENDRTSLRPNIPIRSNPSMSGAISSGSSAVKTSAKANSADKPLAAKIPSATVKPTRAADSKDPNSSRVLIVGVVLVIAVTIAAIALLKS